MIPLHTITSHELDILVISTFLYNTQKIQLPIAITNYI